MRIICNSNCENRYCDRNRESVVMLGRDCVRVEDLSCSCPDYRGVKYCNICSRPLTDDEIRYCETTCKYCK